MKRRALFVVPSLVCALLVPAFSGCDLADPYASSGPAVAAACMSTGTLAPPAAPPPSAPPAGLPLKLTQINPGFALSFPLFLTAPPGDTARLFVVEKGGTIRIVDRATNNLLPDPFLAITSLVTTGSEQGLLGLAFDPDYANNGRFYVSYTDKAGNSVIARYLVSSPASDIAIPTADRVIFTQQQPFENHNGGMIAFGPEGDLYIGFGDGGSGGDPGNRAQNLGLPLGKLLRIDVSDGTPGQPAYVVPAGNPCIGQAGAREEIWSMGLRNPWRWSFDRGTGDLYIADVGQGSREEVDVSSVANGAGRGTNYGWNIMEGSLCYLPSSGCNMNGLTRPHVDYGHAAGACSITGGYVYRGAAVPALQGTYFYADYCAGFVRSFKMAGGVVTEHADWTALRPNGNITSFGEDAAGELYILTGPQGGLYRIESN